VRTWSNRRKEEKESREKRKNVPKIKYNVQKFKKKQKKVSTKVTQSHAVWKKKQANID